MKALSWNIHCLRGGNRDRVASIARAIARHAPDVVALQEVSADSEFVSLLRADLHRNGLVGFHFGAPHPDARKRYGNVIASTGEVTPAIDPPLASGEALHWRHLISSAHVAMFGGIAFEIFSVHIPNGRGNGWAKIDAFHALANELASRTIGPRIVAGDFNEPWRFSGDRLESFALEDGVSLDLDWTRRGKHTPAESRPRREWQDAVSRVLGRDGPFSVRRLPTLGEPAASHVTREGAPRLFDHILVSEHFRSSGVVYDHAVRDASTKAVSDHSLVVADIELV